MNVLAVYPISEQQQLRTKVGGVVDRGQTSRADPEEIREFSRQFPLPGAWEEKKTKEYPTMEAGGSVKGPRGARLRRQGSLNVGRFFVLPTER